MDVSDVDALPAHVAHAAFEEGLVLAGDERLVEARREEIEDSSM